MFDTGEGVSSFTPEFVNKIGCKPWGRITGFRMSGERLDHQHCDGITREISGQHVTVPVVSIIDIMKFLGSEVPPIDGSLGLDIFDGKSSRSFRVKPSSSKAHRVSPHESKMPANFQFEWCGM